MDKQRILDARKGQEDSMGGSPFPNGSSSNIYMEDSSSEGGSAAALHKMSEDVKHIENDINNIPDEEDDDLEMDDESDYDDLDADKASSKKKSSQSGELDDDEGGLIENGSEKSEDRVEFLDEDYAKTKKKKSRLDRAIDGFERYFSFDKNLEKVKEDWDKIKLPEKAGKFKKIKYVLKKGLFALTVPIRYPVTTAQGVIKGVDAVIEGIEKYLWKHIPQKVKNLTFLSVIMDLRKYQAQYDKILKGMIDEDRKKGDDGKDNRKETKLGKIKHEEIEMGNGDMSRKPVQEENKQESDASENIPEVKKHKKEAQKIPDFDDEDKDDIDDGKSLSGDEDDLEPVRKKMTPASVLRNGGDKAADPKLFQEERRKNMPHASPNPKQYLKNTENNQDRHMPSFMEDSLNNSMSESEEMGNNSYFQDQLMQKRGNTQENPEFDNLFS